MTRRLLTYMTLLLALGSAAGLARAEVAQGSGESGVERSLHGPGFGHGRQYGMRGRCGKRRGDCYGARRPVTGADDARSQIVRYYEGQDVTVANLAEKQWRYEADILDRQGGLIDKVMIDKRSGRIRSLF